MNQSQPTDPMHELESEPMAGGLRTLHPSYFALVMATGIVSIAAFLQGMTLVAQAMFGLNIAFYLALLALNLRRAIVHRADMLADFTDHARGVGFFTAIAATCILGSQAIVITGSHGIASACWILGLVLWLVLIYGIFTLLTVRRHKPGLAEGMNGGWLVAVVATQSVSILGVQLVPGVDGAREPLLFLSLVLWLGAGMLYLWLITLIFYRCTFFSLKADQLAPPYWINMGAAAISTLAGAYLVDAATLSPLLSELLPFTKGLTLLYWATACWWIPLLLALGAWRHLWCRYPLRYDPLYWGAVFPLGMFTVCTQRLTEVLPVGFLSGVPRVGIVVAFVAWGVAFIGLCRAVIRKGRFTGRSVASP
ncbi:MAG: tellurite resistance/C4-dicarboxylate transporter family protein [Phycisphaerales bacterium JB065]